ncbi:unnamed protein product [Euphydryas editha]|uniref:MADF domain-containing protein n=1 Tax=Euphydryas editha TaxID=104508 RepID=A0AAU9TX00_EUPED|nr:unnamed protein product [Euphydryas editha]
MMYDVHSKKKASTTDAAGDPELQESDDDDTTNEDDSGNFHSLGVKKYINAYSVISAIRPKSFQTSYDYHETRTMLLSFAEERNDSLGEQEMDVITRVNSLVEVKARYHHQFLTDFQRLPTDLNDIEDSPPQNSLYT